jgi:hypothetical protein
MPYETIFGTRWKWSFAAQRSQFLSPLWAPSSIIANHNCGTRPWAYEGHCRRSAAVCVLRPPASH